ncbi:MAG TPA: GNAT family N-acetyltransferase [Rhizomicrobium sp.]|nr:GNAT family N-acetyltransferase [Rhizomicrobium sp.]
MTDPIIRPAEPADLPALLDIYNHYVLTTPVTFDIEPRSLEQRREWFDQFSRQGRYRCFVAEREGRATGWACSARFKEKAAYETTIETSVYLAPETVGQGLGRALYTTLFAALKDEDIHRAFAGVTVPNDASVALHGKMEFECVGTYREVGRKFGRFWDTALFMRDIAAR